MPKLKTSKAVKKRFKVTATGKVLRHKPNHRHLMSGKSAKRRRHLKSTVVVDPLQGRKLLSVLHD